MYLVVQVRDRDRFFFFFWKVLEVGEFLGHVNAIKMLSYCKILQTFFSWVHTGLFLHNLGFKVKGKNKKQYVESLSEYKKVITAVSLWVNSAASSSPRRACLVARVSALAHHHSTSEGHFLHSSTSVVKTEISRECSLTYGTLSERI